MIFLLCVKKAGEQKWSENCLHAELGLGRLVKGHPLGLTGLLSGGGGWGGGKGLMVSQGFFPPLLPAA